MNFKWLFISGFIFLVLLFSFFELGPLLKKLSHSPTKISTSGNIPTVTQSSIVYTNAHYGFHFTLPNSWQGYSVVTDYWDGVLPSATGQQMLIAKGPLLLLRHPLWTEKNRRQDIPIMIFTILQWNDMQQGKFHIGAAPFNPSELGRNNKFVFAIPARYNYAFPSGYQEVDSILSNKSLQPFNL